MLCLACAEEASSRGKHSSTFEVLRIDLFTGENTDNSKYKEHRAQEEKKKSHKRKEQEMLQGTNKEREYYFKRIDRARICFKWVGSCSSVLP